MTTYANTTFRDEWIGGITTGSLYFRCETCAALLKNHPLDAIKHAEWHAAVSGLSTEGAAPVVWLVTRVGVYDHGVCYIAETEAGALRFTEEYAPDDDGYHTWRIEPIEVGVPTGEATTPRFTPPTQQATS